MRIRRLDITGFKSFMDRAVFTFDEGITGVVGPNGCGKSNVVDAIRWVMGEQSAKHLRGRGMEDVIFNGSETKPPLSMAEVSLTFEVDPRDTLAPQYAGFGEVTVTRRLFRSGESEYLINRTVCRLLDVVELFLGTGVTPPTDGPLQLSTECAVNATGIWATALVQSGLFAAFANPTALPLPILSS